MPGCDARHEAGHDDCIVAADSVIYSSGGSVRSHTTSELRSSSVILLKLDVAPGVARRHQFVIRQPVVVFFSAAYFAAASLTMGAIMESSAVIQSDAIFHFLPSQVWMRPVRVPS